MKMIIRNFLSMLRRFKIAMLLNVAGLAVAFAAFIIILIQVNYERNFDHCHPTAERVFRVELTSSGTFSTILPRAFIESVIPSSPHIEAGTLINPYIGSTYFSVLENGEKVGYREQIETCHPALVKVFDFPILEGNPDCLSEPDKVLLPESMARKMFGNQSAVGKSIHAEEAIWSKNRTDFTVGAVYSDFPGNTQVKNVIYTAMDPDFALTNFGASNYYCLLLLDDESSAQDVVDNFNRTFDFKKLGKDKAEELMKLTPLTDIYYLNESQDGRIFRSGNKEVTTLLFCIALLIIIVAAINFTNFSTALTPLRIKSINTQKVLGSSEGLLRRVLLVESAIISVIAWVLSLAIVWIVSETAALPFVEANLDLLVNLPLVGLTGVIALFTGVIAGLYPSCYITSFPPALVLKGSFGLSASGRKLRTGLISIQFVVSILLIISACFVQLQNQYMRGYSLGFDKDQIAIVELSGDIYTKHRDTYTNRLKEFGGIEEVAFTREKVASQDGYATNGGTYKNKDFQYFLIDVSANFLRVMGIPVIEGRDFSRADELSEEGAYIFNNTAYKEMEMEAGTVFGEWIPGRIVGFTGDAKLTSLRQGENNIAFVVVKSPYSLPVSYIRIKTGTDMHAAVEHIRKTLSDIDPAFPFDVEFYDTIFDQLYHKEENLRSLITVFSILAIIISLVGVFGLVIFETQYRRKEISIRKVHGATVGEILYMFNKSYLKVVAVCFVIAAPVAWYGVNIWLESFVYKTPMYWWVFVVAFLIVTAITMATVTFQNWRAANANPVKSLKAE